MGRTSRGTVQRIFHELPPRSFARSGVHRLHDTAMPTFPAFIWRRERDEFRSSVVRFGRFVDQLVLRRRSGSRYHRRTRGMDFCNPQNSIADAEVSLKIFKMILRHLFAALCGILFSSRMTRGFLKIRCLGTASRSHRRQVLRTPSAMFSPRCGH